MSSHYNISATIVLFKEQEDVLLKAVNSFLAYSGEKKLFLVDNSPTPVSNSYILNHPEITYIFNDKNLGFSRANNLVLREIKDNSRYHLVLNTDTFFKPQVLDELIEQFEINEDLALVAPAIKYPDGEHQYSVRKYPNFLDLLFRKTGINKKRIYQQEYRNLDLSKPFFPEAIHGCFMLFKTEDFMQINGFDERYFLYMEDLDICKKIDQIGKKKYYFPSVEVTHVLRKGSAKNIKLFFYHFSSAVKYFLKWL